ncbi:aminopeptidase N-like [Ptychodera flava]|uniref:aminopeptidase N-like n=1 Tax=Ptychodera flava TaxID=63121 RepID=UPI00396A83E0
MTYDTKYSPEEKKGGCFVTKAMAITLTFLVILVIVGAALMAYYIPQNVCEATPTPGEPEETKMPDDTVVREPGVEFNGRLPDTLVPYHYEVELRPYLDEEKDGDKWKTNEGKVVIYLTCVKNTKEIKVHHDKMEIQSRAVKDADGSEVGIASTEIDALYNWYIIHTVDELQAGTNYTINMTFVGTVIQADARGFYYSSYTEDGKTTPFVASHFEPTRVRDAFPCLDEPHLKATFATTLVHRKMGVSRERIALSNMPIIRNETFTEGGDEWVKTHFNTSVKMPSYLNCYAIGEFICKEDKYRDYQFRTWSRPSVINATEYSLKVGMEQLGYFEDTFEIPYDLPKMDFVALTEFSPGAMENWGLVLYRESTMLYPIDDRKTPATKKGVAAIVAHELLHQWFGNYVTMVWWDHIWLNEGFATYFQHFAAQHSEPQYDFYEQLFLGDETYRAMEVDQLGTSRPLVTPSGFYAEIRFLFDRISYDKGGALIMMIKSFLGEDKMLEGFRNYLKEYIFNNAHTDDLWQSLNEVQGNSLDVRTIMDTWSLQMGFPVVTITRHSEDHTKATADQTQYLLYPFDEPKDDDYTDRGYKWYIPLTFTHKSEREYNEPSLSWLERESADLDFEGINEDDWYLANINQTAYIRVNYDVDNWRKLAKQLNESFEVIPLRSRSHLLDDALHLGRSHHLDHVIALELMEYLRHEDQHLPWNTVYNDHFFTAYMLWRSSTYGMFQKYMRYLISPSYDHLGWDFDYTYSEGNEIEYYRQLTTLRTACEYNHAECVGNATQLYHDWISNPDGEHPIDPNMRSSAYCTVIRHGSYVEWESAYIRQSVDLTEGSRLRSALGCSREPYTLIGYMEKSMDTSNGLSASSTIGSVRDNSGLGFTLAWEFTMDHFDALHERYGDSAYGIVWAFADKMNSQNDLDQLNAFGERYYDMPGEEAVKFYEAVDKVTANIAWADRNMGAIKDFLSDVMTRIR